MSNLIIMKQVEKVYQINGEIISESEAKFNNFSVKNEKLSTLAGITKDLQWNPPYEEILEVAEGLFKFNFVTKQYEIFGKEF